MTCAVKRTGRDRWQGQILLIFRELILGVAVGSRNRTQMLQFFTSLYDLEHDWTKVGCLKISEGQKRSLYVGYFFGVVGLAIESGLRKERANKMIDWLYSVSNLAMNVK